MTDYRHVRTGEHRGTITRMVRGEPREFPRAITACGADQTGADLGRTQAIDVILEAPPELAQMCHACRERVEDVTGAKTSTLRGKITGPQMAYLRRLLIEAESHHYHGDVHIDRHHMQEISARYASFAIEHLSAAKERGWTERLL